MTNNDNVWDIIIDSRSSGGKSVAKEIFRYKDLIVLFVRRDLVSIYKQTLLGPLWILLQPLLTSVMYYFIFGQMAGLSTDSSPRLLFYLCGVTIWTLFAECLLKTADTFSANANLFGKVYFPRIVVPVSIAISNLFKFLVTLCLFVALWIYEYSNGANVSLNGNLILLLPVAIIATVFTALGMGLLVSALTARYRDLKFLVQFGVQLLMFASPIVYPLSMVSGKMKIVLLANPMSGVIETFKAAFLHSDSWQPYYLMYSAGVSVIIFVSGLFVFNRVEKTFIDSI